MKRPTPFPANHSPNDPPFTKGDTVYIDHNFSNGIGGKRATVEGCESNSEFHSGWGVKIDKYPSPIDAGWLIKIPNA